MTLPNLHKFNILLFVHKFFHHRHQLLHFFIVFHQKSDLHSYNNLLVQNELHLEYYSQPLWGKDLLHMQEVKLRCSLPKYLKYIISTRLFKLKLK